MLTATSNSPTGTSVTAWSMARPSLVDEGVQAAGVGGLDRVLDLEVSFDEVSPAT